MIDDCRPHLARIDKRELVGLAACPTNRDKGRYLWSLLHEKGIAPQRIYRIDYFPHRRCWLLTQDPGPALPQPAADSLSGARDDELFFRQTMADFRRSAVLAFGATAAQSRHFATFGRVYQLHPAPEELTLAKLIDLLGGRAGDEGIHFDSEGGWQPFPTAET